MSTLGDPATRKSCSERLSRLTPSTRGKWGKMTPHQAVCHLNDSFEAVLGRKDVSSATGLFQRTMMRWVALHTPLRWPKGVPTRPEIDQAAGGGTPPVNWDADCAALCRWIETFPETQQFRDHPIFGPLDRDEWMIWGYRHLDHHLRQFGV